MAIARSETAPVQARQNGKLPFGTLAVRYASMLTLALGIALFVRGLYLETRNPRTGDEDLYAWRVLAVAVSLINAGVALPRCHVAVVVLIAVASPYVAYVAVVIAVWTLILTGAMWSRLGLL